MSRRRITGRWHRWRLAGVSVDWFLGGGSNEPWWTHHYPARLDRRGVAVGPLFVMFWRYRRHADGELRFRPGLWR